MADCLETNAFLKKQKHLTSLLIILYSKTSKCYNVDISVDTLFINNNITSIAYLK